MSGLSDRDIAETVQRYTDRYETFGYSPMTLGWNKGRQHIRFEALTSLFPLKGKRILDIGCGFGDLNTLLVDTCGDDYQYLGIDLVPSLVAEAKVRWQRPNVEFLVGDFLKTDFKVPFDIAIASGIFNHRLSAGDNYEVIHATIARTFSLVKDGLAFDFLSDQVDFTHAHTFHSAPSRLLQMAYGFSRKVVLRNDYLPFEFAIFVSHAEVDKETSTYLRSQP
ncbi:MAG: class I SAM-dependent methyltransferase [Planctomycetaceae bacterium]|nr:class I SAM-dependent methyltransferase [Planctomycetaceae bacterium]